MKTAQEIFDLVATHLLTQKRPAMHDGKCAYRAPDGKRCALGVLIPDELYTPAMEGSGIHDTGEGGDLVRIAIERLGLTPFTDFLANLQGIHDSCNDCPGAAEERWTKDLQDFATEHGLVMVKVPA